MTIMENVESAAKPPALSIGERYADAATDVRETSRDLGDGAVFKGWTYTLTRYGLGEYIAKQDAELTNVQLALCEMAEGE